MQKLHSTSQVKGGAGQALARGREATRQRETRGDPQGLPVTPRRGEKDAGEAHFPITPGPAQSWKPAHMEETRTERFSLGRQV